MASWWKIWHPTRVSSDKHLEAQLESEIQLLREKTPVPTIWMFGKTGSGKSSIVRYLTGAEAATIGEGFRPETRTSRRYDFPDSRDPLLTFVDTRGLGEARYRPDEDIERFSSASELMIVTVRLTDHALDCLLDPLRRIRKEQPQRPVLLVLSCLHQAPGAIDISAGEDVFDTDHLAASQVDRASAGPSDNQQRDHQQRDHQQRELQQRDHQQRELQTQTDQAASGQSRRPVPTSVQT